MEFAVLTIFPEMFAMFREQGIIRKALADDKIALSVLNIRDFATDRHRTTDDRPYGGGCGMVMKPEPLAQAIRTAKAAGQEATTVLLSPQGEVFHQGLAWDIAQSNRRLILVCGRYEGIDERVTDLVDAQLSIGDYVLTGGELAAMVIIDAVARLIPGVLGGETSAIRDSFSGHLLEHPHYTRPPVFEGQPVPEVLLSGNHAKIETWRKAESLLRTLMHRPDLLQTTALDPMETELLKQWRKQLDAIIDAQAIPGPDSPSGDQQAS